MLDSHLTNLGSGVIRPTQSLASSPVTDRMTLNHLHSKGGWLHWAGCNHKPCVDMVNALRMERGRSTLDGTLLLLFWGNVSSAVPTAVSLNLVMFGKCINHLCKCRDHSSCRQWKQTQFALWAQWDCLSVPSKNVTNDFCHFRQMSAQSCDQILLRFRCSLLRLRKGLQLV